LTTTSRYEDVSLLHAARDGDPRARERIVAGQLALVRSVAAHYRDLGLPLEDLVQEGSMGLLEAIATFDPERGSDFDAYARFRVRRSIRNALTEQSRLIRLPKQVVERRRAIARAESAFTAATGHPPTVVELSDATGLSPAAVVQTQGIAGAPVSLDTPLLDDGTTLEGALADTSASDPAAETVDHEQVELVDDAVAHLPERQREVIARHYGFGGTPEDIAAVAAALRLSRQRVRTIERDALYRLRNSLEHPLDARHRLMPLDDGRGVDGRRQRAVRKSARRRKP